MNNRSKLILGGVFLLAVGLVADYGIHHADQQPLASTAGHTLTEAASSDGSLTDVTYTAGTGTQQDTSPADPWSVSWQDMAALPFTVTMVVQAGGDSSTVTCTITEDGRVVDTHTSNGPYAVVQCSH